MQRDVVERAMDLTWTATATSAVAGPERMCALMPNGEVFCNGVMPLADGGDERIDTPIQVPGLDDAVAIAADQMRVCAIVTDGKLRCWGWSGWDETTDSETYDLTPVEVPGLTGVTSVALGYTDDGYGSQSWRTATCAAGGPMPLGNSATVAAWTRRSRWRCRTSPTRPP